MDHVAQLEYNALVDSPAGPDNVKPVSAWEDALG